MLLFVLLRGPLGAGGANAAALAVTAIGNTAANRRLTFGVRGRAHLLRDHLRGAVVFAVCGGLQLLGHGYELAGERLPGVGLVDLDTRREDGPRLLGNIAIELDLPGGPPLLAGFENHAGRTYLGSGERPLGRVVHGNGNNGHDKTEGVRGGPHGTVIGTYMHGPLLPKNTAFADWLTATALGIAMDELPPLDDALEGAAHAEAARAAGV
jgi:CobQ-like glutamine amidotransferase family enzyme